MQGNTTSESEARRIQGAEVKTYPTYGEAFDDLAAGRIDAVIADYPSALNFVAQSGGKLKVVGEVFTDESYGIAVCKTRPEFLEMINRGLAAAKTDGTFRQLEQKWLASQ